MELLVYRPLRHKGASSLVLMLSSLGLFIILQNLISMIFGNEVKSIQTGDVVEGINILQMRITVVQIGIVLITGILVIFTSFLIKKTKIGIAMRAIANDPELANISGIDSDMVILYTFAMGSALAGIAGILLALDVDMIPSMGINAFMIGIVVIIVGGIGSISGTALGSLLIGMAQHLGTWKISSQWQDAIAFIVLLIFLLYRPYGFFGKKIQKVEV